MLYKTNRFSERVQKLTLVYTEVLIKREYIKIEMESNSFAAVELVDDVCRIPDDSVRQN